MRQCYEHVRLFAKTAENTGRTHTDRHIHSTLHRFHYFPLSFSLCLKSEFHLAHHVSTQHDTFDVSSQTSSWWRACQTVLFDKLDAAKMSNVSCRDVTWRAKWL